MLTVAQLIIFMLTVAHLMNDDSLANCGTTEDYSANCGTNVDVCANCGRTNN